MKLHKLRVYLDTSVISHLQQRDTPQKMADTLLFWEDCKSEKYNLIVSDLTLDEMDKCAEPKRSFMLDKLAEVQYQVVFEDANAVRLHTLYFDAGGLPPKSRDDALHIAIATASKCDIILSWNFKHIVNLRAMAAVDAVNHAEGHPVIRILSPSMFLELAKGED